MFIAHTHAGGDPQQLSAYMVRDKPTTPGKHTTFTIISACSKPFVRCTAEHGSALQVEHRGVMPSLVPKPGSYLQIVDQRKQLREVIWSCWPAVSQPSPHQPDLPFAVRP